MEAGVSYFDEIARDNLRRTLGLTGWCPSTNGQGTGCTNPAGHDGRHWNQHSSAAAWDDDAERDRLHQARRIAEHLRPQIRDAKISDIEQAVGLAVVELLAELGVTKPATGDL